MTDSAAFTPAAGRFAPTSLYDRGVALLTRESIWRGELVKRISPEPGDAILDVGCGTGSLAILLKQAAPDTRIVGLDPDAEALTIAKRKARAAGVEIEWCQGFAQDAASFGSFDKVVSSLVFHQVPLAGKRSGIAAMFAAVKTGGLVCIADYALQGAWPMRQLFRFIQMIDGRENTWLNADGFIEAELEHIVGKRSTPAFTLDTPQARFRSSASANPNANFTRGTPMRTWIVLIAALAAQPVLAHSGAEHRIAAESQTTAVTNVLAAYKAAIERLDGSGTERLFTADSAIFESGGSEGTYSNYLAHHLSPELKEFKSFAYSNYKISVRFEGPLALVTESYSYRIETRKGEVAERLGVATSVLKKTDGHWQIISMHNSSRRPAAR